MPILNVYLDDELYERVKKEAPDKPSRLVQEALRKYLGIKEVRK